MASVSSNADGLANASDWNDRYFHVDQILDRPGPRTDPSFAAGDEVPSELAFATKAHVLCIGQGLFEEPV